MSEGKIIGIIMAILVIAAIISLGFYLYNKQPAPKKAICNVNVNEHIPVQNLANVNVNEHIPVQNLANVNVNEHISVQNLAKVYDGELKVFPSIIGDYVKNIDEAICATDSSHKKYIETLEKQLIKYNINGLSDANREQNELMFSYIYEIYGGDNKIPET
jgi:hypothetical protein